MNPEFPIHGVRLTRVKAARRVAYPLFSDATWQLNQHEFAMQVDGVGSFYAFRGREVEYAPAEGASQASVELFLNGSVYGAILHQRNILPLHGSSFIWREQGVMICGESGTGKSSLTAAFCLNGAAFLTDDVSPVVLNRGVMQVMPRSGKLKLNEDALQQLNLQSDGLTPVHPAAEKYLLPLEKGIRHAYPLHRLYILEMGTSPGIEAEWLTGIESFRALRNEIYRWEYLPAMKDSEISYMEQILFVSRQARVARVRRHGDVRIEEMMQFLSDHMERNP